MSKVIVLNENLQKANEIELDESYKDINSHNLYLYIKSYLASLRANTAHTKGRSDVSGGGKKPWRQKGRGGARAGSTRTNVWVGGAVAFGPTNNKNYFQKVNKKQKRLAFKFAMQEKANLGKIFVVDSVRIESGKTKDAFNFIKKLNLRDVLIVGNFSSEVDEKKFEEIENTFLAYRNLRNCYCADVSEINPYLVSVYSAVIFEKSAFENLS